MDQTPEHAAARCPLHPDALAVGACKRCGTFACAACAHPEPGGGLRCPACWERTRTGGFTSQLPVLSILTLINGALILLLGLFSFGVFIAFFVSAFGERDPEERDLMTLIYGGSGLFYCGVGAAQLYAGVLIRRRQRYRTVIAAIASGLLTALTCYCVVPSLALFIYGLIILTNKEVAASFDLDTPKERTP